VEFENAIELTKLARAGQELLLGTNLRAVSATAAWRTVCLDEDCVHLCELSFPDSSHNRVHAAVCRTRTASCLGHRAGQVLTACTHRHQRQVVVASGDVKGRRAVFGPARKLASRPSRTQVSATRYRHDAEANHGNLWAGAATIGNATAVGGMNVPTCLDSTPIDGDASRGCQREKQSYNSSHGIPGRFITAKSKFRPRTRSERSSPR
jgi:hypothetical protein